MNALLECRNLTKSYGRKPALSNVDLTISPGRIVGLLGPNGSGKSTLIKLANGLLTPTAGEILVCGKRPGVESHLAVSYLPDKNYLNDWMRVSDIISYFSDFYHNFDANRARDYILNTIITNYDEQASIVLSTHLIADIEKVLDDVIFLAEGRVALVSSVDEIREKNGKSVDTLFREVYKC